MRPCRAETTCTDRWGGRGVALALALALLVALPLLAVALLLLLLVWRGLGVEQQAVEVLVVQ